MTRSPVVITGGAGFLGEHLARSFVAAGSRVRLFDTAPLPDWGNAAGIEYVYGDVRDADAVQRSTIDASAIVHAAFASPRKDAATIRTVNVDGSSHVRQAALKNGVRRIVVVSSTVVTGPPRPHPFWASSPLGRLDLYRTTRIEAERILMEQPGESLSVAVVRPQSFLGPGRLGAFGIIFELIRTGEPVPVLGAGTHCYQLLAVQDLAEGIRMLVRSDSIGSFGFGARVSSTVRDDLQALIAGAGSKSTLRHISPSFSRAALRFLELAGFVPLSEWHRHSAWGRDSLADCIRSQKELGWSPRLGNVEALTQAYAWYVDRMISTGVASRTHPLPRSHIALKTFIRLLPSA